MRVVPSGVGRGVGVILAVGVAVGVGEAVGVLVGVRVAVALGVAVGDGVVVGEGVGDEAAVAVGVVARVGEGVADATGLVVGCGVAQRELDVAAWRWRSIPTDSDAEEPPLWQATSAATSPNDARAARPELTLEWCVRIVVGKLSAFGAICQMDQECGCKSAFAKGKLALAPQEACVISLKNTTLHLVFQHPRGVVGQAFAGSQSGQDFNDI